MEGVPEGEGLCLSEYLMGSITERVLHHSKLPLLIVRPPREQYVKQEVKEGTGEAVKVDVESWVGLF